jgi:hypothetical protein
MRLPRKLARRLDRLARHAHAFHRFAHHPLCDEYAAEVIRIGRRSRVCRGCALVLAGSLVGLGGGLALGVPPGAALCLAAVIVPGSLQRRRRHKVLTRLLPAAALGMSVGAGLSAFSIGGLLAAGTALLAFGAVAVAYRRRGPDRTPCTTCPERALPVPCRGLRPMVRRERAFQRVADRLITACASQGPTVTSTS